MTTLSPTHYAEPAEVYHASPAWGRSGIWQYRLDRTVCRDVFVERTHPGKPVTKPMEFGSLVNDMLLLNRPFSELCAAYPAKVLGKNGRLGTNAANEFAAECRARGVVPMKQSDIDRALIVEQRFRAVFGKWLSLAKFTEQSLYWTDALTGLECKCRPDWLCLSDDGWFIFDLKTSYDPRPRIFRKVIEDGLWMQAVHYIAGVEAVFGGRANFKFVVVQTDYPYKCAVHELKENSLVQAQAERNATLVNLKACLDSGDWSEPWESVVNTVELRPWCFETN